MNKPRLIVIDDEPEIGELIGFYAEEAGYQALVSVDPESFRRHCVDGADVVVLDLVIPGADGVELIRLLAEGAAGCNPRLILMSGFDARVLHTAAELAAAHGLTVAARLTKPIQAAELRAALATAAPMPVAPCRPSPSDAPEVDELRAALAENRIVAHFQPKVSLADGRVLGFEALARWQRCDGTWVPPDTFVPLAETHGMIDALSATIMEQALVLVREAGLLGSVAVNLSVASLADLHLPERIVGRLMSHGLAPRRLTIEVTESGLMRELVTSLDVLARLRLKGIGLSIDDFGTGYSSMQQLRRVPFTEMKIDRGFVRVLDSDHEARAIVETTVALGHRLGMKVVAEGVETEAQWNALAELGCDVAQGYLIGRPMPGGDVPAWLAEWMVQNRRLISGLRRAPSVRAPLPLAV